MEAHSLQLTGSRASCEEVGNVLGSAGVGDTSWSPVPLVDVEKQKNWWLG
jgi:hypothetical protein